MFDLDALRLLVTVARTGSFTAAATALNYTQSAVSRRIAGLEQQAGGPLFERLPRGVRLTPAGAALHRHAVQILDRAARAADELAAIHGGYGGTLRLGAFATANVALVPRALSMFREAHPDVELTPVEGTSASLMRALGDGSLDLAVVSDYPSGLPAAEGVVLEVLLQDEMHVALPRTHPLAGSPTVDLRDLRDAVWIQAAPPDRPTMLAAACARAGFAPARIVRIAEWTGKFGYVAAGLGVTLVPSLAFPAVPAELVLRPLGELAPRRTVQLALPAAPLPAARSLAGLLRETAARM